MAADEETARQKAEEVASYQATIDELKAQLSASTDTADTTADVKSEHAHASIERFEAEAAAQQATIDELKAQLAANANIPDAAAATSTETQAETQVSKSGASAQKKIEALQSTVSDQAAQIQALEGTQTSASAANQTNSKKDKWHPSAFTMAELHQYLKDLFSIADANGDGILQLPELKQLLQLCGFELTAEQIANFVAEVDKNGDGVIEYNEFVPVMSKMLQESKPSRHPTKRTRNTKQVSATDAAQQAAQIQALEGTQESASAANQTNSKKDKWHPSAFTMAELHQYLKDLFSIADANGDGILQLPELKQLLQLCGFELTAEQIANFVAESYTSVLTVICCSEQAAHIQLLESKLLQQSEAAEQTAREVRELTTQLQDAERVLRQSQSVELLAEVFSMGCSMVVFSSVGTISVIRSKERIVTE